jgi:hypothetical protein
VCMSWAVIVYYFLKVASNFKLLEVECTFMIVV